MDVSAISFEQTGLDYFEKAQRPPAIGVEPDIFTAPAPLIVVFLPLPYFSILKTAFCVASPVPFTLSSRHSFPLRIKLCYHEPPRVFLSIDTIKI